MTKQHSQSTDVNTDQRAYASPPCSLHQFEDTTLDTDALIALLNELVEGERAGAQGVLAMSEGIESAETSKLMREVARDEARFCAMLSHHVVRLGGEPNRTTGPFAEKLARREPFDAKLALLDKGQSVVVRVLSDTIPQITDAILKQDLIEMRDVHVMNIERCNSLRIDREDGVRAISRLGTIGT